MNPLAIMMLVLSIVVLWGGLTVSIVLLSRFDKRTGEHDFETYEDHTL
ncbi:methionine/alanine import family NSS transporter small subunit [Timonella senegalensis]|nr:methionine/alanine import family NSS transporter small subunit [Timonella senegalensis]